MIDDIVKRLREYRIGCGFHCEAHDAKEPLSECLEAADEIMAMKDELHHCFHRIEKLQAALRETMNGTPGWYDLARKALEGKNGQ